MNWLGTEAD